MSRIHHEAGRPAPCWRVRQHEIEADLIDLLGALADAFRTQGRSWGWNRTTPVTTAFRMALHRLRRAGLVVHPSQGGRTPGLYLTRDGDRRISSVIRPERLWNRRWGGVWYILMYDVPEKDRHYRRVLRCFLKRLRMGGLQKSVWITCDDIRPDMADLQKTAALEDFAVLLEARTVLGQTGPDLADRAWNFGRIRQEQQVYRAACAKRMAEPMGAMSVPAILARMRWEQESYVAAMRHDPLLPKSLWPSGYEGPATVALFRARLAELSTHL